MNAFIITGEAKDNPVAGFYYPTATYQQTLTVVADTQDEAILVAKKWMEKKGASFCLPENTWSINLIENIQNNTVIDENEDFDY